MGGLARRRCCFLMCLFNPGSYLRECAPQDGGVKGGHSGFLLLFRVFPLSFCSLPGSHPLPPPPPIPGGLSEILYSNELSSEQSGICFSCVCTRGPSCEGYVLICSQDTSFLSLGFSIHAPPHPPPKRPLRVLVKTTENDYFGQSSAGHG